MYSTYRDIRRGDVVMVPGLIGKQVIVYVAKRLRMMGNKPQHRITLNLVSLSDVQKGTVNPVETPVHIGSFIEADRGRAAHISDVRKVGRVDFKKEENVTYTATKN